VYRVRIDATFYPPFYRAIADGIQITAPPWNDHDPAAPVPTFARAILLPSPLYPFPSYTRVLRGELLDTATGLPAVDALVVAGTDSRALSDKRGEFALALRWAPDGPLSITATARRLDGVAEHAHLGRDVAQLLHHRVRREVRVDLVGGRERLFELDEQPRQLLIAIRSMVSGMRTGERGRRWRVGAPWRPVCGHAKRPTP
jgi:hypothetical protein